MLTVGLILLAVVAHSSCRAESSDECPFDLKKCREEQLPWEIPNTSSKLKDACSAISEYVECNLACGPISTAKDFKFVEYLLSLCDEDSHTYKVIDTNIECIADSVQQVADSCIRRILLGDNKEFFEILSKYVEDIESLSPQEGNCASMVNMFTCISMVVGIPCGAAVEEVAYDALVNMDDCNKFCNPVIQTIKQPLRSDLRRAFYEDEEFMNSIRHSNNATAGASLNQDR